MNFKNLLSKNELKQINLALKLSVTQQLVSCWVVGRCEPSISQLPKLAEILHCSISELVMAIIETGKEKENNG